MTRSIDRRLFLERFAAAAAPLAAARRAAAWQGPAGKTYTYKTAGGCAIQADVVSGDGPAPKPVVIWIHGGALIIGSRTDMPSFLRELAQNDGYAVVSIDYRLAPNTKLPAIIEDIQDAHRWVRAQGPKLLWRRSQPHRRRRRLGGGLSDPDERVLLRPATQGAGVLLWIRRHHGRLV